MSEFNFSSQVCTSRLQSEKLLALGLKKDTADMFWWDNGYCSCTVISRPAEKEDGEYGKVIPAWSLGRLIKDLMPQSIGHLELAVGSDYAGYYEDRCESESRMWWEYSSETSDMFDNIISTIEWLIKEGYFNKEYLV